MSKNNSSKSSLFNRLLNNNKAVFVLSVLISLILWIFVSFTQTTEIEKNFTNVKVKINVEGSMADNNNLKLFGDDEISVDITVKGKSYIVNASDFADKLVVSVPLTSVTSSGTYSLPVSAAIDGVSSSDAEITAVSKSTVTLYFDEEVEKTFDLNIDIEEDSEKYKLPEGYVRENPRLSSDKVTLTGPALEISRISSVNAVVKLDKELTGTEAFEAKIVPVGSNDNTDFPNVKRVNEEPVYVTIPVSYKSEFSTAVSFTGMPNAYKTDGVKYTVSPSKVSVNASASDTELISSGKINIGSIDFSDINNEVNKITFSAEDLSYSFADNTTSFTVVIDMSSMEKRWLEVPVSTDDLKLPDGAELVDTSVKSVQVIGPANSVKNIDASEVLAVLDLSGIELKKGTNDVPVKISLRTLTDSWVRGEYTVRVEVK